MSCCAEGEIARSRSAKTAPFVFLNCTPRSAPRCLPPPLDRAAPRRVGSHLSQQRSLLLPLVFAVIRAGGIAVPLNPQLSLSEVRRILANSGTEIIVTDKAVFSAIVNRGALNVRAWIQADDEAETMDGFVRADLSRRRRRRLPSILLPPSPSFTLPAPAGFQRERLSQATPCSERERPRCFPDFFLAPGISHSSRCHGRTLWPQALRFTG